ncbi:MAG: tRNA pseudouridine synthase [Bryobacterales bacterium]|jgi:tRNA pseudouridine55 synthase|nr:tRNA pseudouridine synthase [Bryobacterales bacterium]
MNGLVLIDKPGGCTSHDVVNRWRKLAQTKRVGHLGTLDPMATGLLALVTGQATRLAQFFGRDEKTYEAEITLGVISNTYDAEGEVEETGIPVPSDRAAIVSTLDRFRGRFLQTPPAVSAKKVGGVAAYKLARKQIAVDLVPIEVEVSDLKIAEISEGRIRLSITSSAGTYIRSIAHDLGQALGCGGLLSKLRRTKVGPFRVESARTLPELEQLASEGRLQDAVLASAKLLPQFPSEYVGVNVEAQIRQGRDFRTSPFSVPPGSPFVKALSYSGELIAIGELRIPNIYHPSTVL